MPTIRAYIGIGANLGDPVQQILDACRQLSISQGVSGLERSALYLTSPVGYDDQAEFVNCVGTLETNLSAQQLLTTLQTIEFSLGRQRDDSNQNAARLIDLDILLFGDKEIHTDRLVVPHPRLTQRLFTLMPLLELAEKRHFSELAFVADAIKQGSANELFVGQDIYRLT